MGSPLPAMPLCHRQGGKKLALVVNSGDNWAYTFAWLNEDAQHVPFPKEGHLSIMINAVPSRSVCRCLYQLEVH